MCVCIPSTQAVWPSERRQSAVYIAVSNLAQVFNASLTTKPYPPRSYSGTKVYAVDCDAAGKLALPFHIHWFPNCLEGRGNF